MNNQLKYGIVPIPVPGKIEGTVTNASQAGEANVEGTVTKCDQGATQDGVEGSVTYDK